MVQMDNVPASELTPAWAVYFCVMLTYIGIQTLCFLALIHWGAQTIRCKLCGGGTRRVAEPVAAVVPCYLPNEAGIIKDTIRHLLEELTQLDNLTVYIVYNTPKSMGIEAELQEIAHGPLPKGRRLVVRKAEASTSKAQNLNEVVPDISEAFVAIYDADHYPDPTSLAFAVGHLQDHAELDCVQGSMYIRGGGSVLMRMWINAEYFMNYFVVLPMLERVAGSGFFSGANGVWRAGSLQRMRFDEQAMTEDIDCSMRAVMQHDMKFQFQPDCRSGELAPIGLRAFLKQRLRWAMGWDETSLKLGPQCMQNKEATWRSRWAVFYLLLCRYFSQLNSTIVISLNIASSGFLAHAYGDAESIPQRPPLCIQYLNCTAQFYFWVFMISSCLQLALRATDLCTVVGVVVYFVMLPFYVFWNTFMVCVSLMKVVTGTQGEWTVTARPPAAPCASTDFFAAVDCADGLESHRLLTTCLPAGGLDLVKHAALPKQ